MCTCATVKFWIFKRLPVVKKSHTCFGGNNQQWGREGDDEGDGDGKNAVDDDKE